MWTRGHLRSVARGNRTRAKVAMLCAALILNAATLQGCVSYKPTPIHEVPFMEHAQTESQADVTVTTAALGREDSKKVFPVNLDRHGVQPVWLEIENESQYKYSFFQQSIDPQYFAASEAAYKSHYSATKRFLSYGVVGILLWPLLVVAPVQFVSARIANNRMDEHFIESGIGNFVLAPGESREGFVFTHVDEGTKEVNVSLLAAHASHDFEFFVEVPGLKRDYERVQFETLYEGQTIPDLSGPDLANALAELPCCVKNKKGDKNGDPMNLVLVGTGEAVLEGIIRAGWDETEVITGGSGLRTFKSFLFSSKYRYSPVSSLYNFDRPQDVAFQKARETIHERNHMRLWLAPFTHQSKPVWVGQVSRDIGVKFHWKTITTHAIDGDVDDARENVIGDLIQAGRLSGFGFVPGVGKTDPENLPKNLTGDSYHTDGMRAVVVIERDETSPVYLDWAD
jgi:hypothetical protein